MLPAATVAAAPSSLAVKTSAPPLAAESATWAERVQRDATVVVNRIRLHDGVTGWPFDKLFDARLLKGAVQICLIDPYLAGYHQIRNLNEFLLHVAETARPKTIELVTGFAPLESAGHQERAIDDTAKDLFQNFGVALTIRRDTGLHDRCLVLDHGVLFKLGRGLGIYKPATGLAAHRAASRRVRETEIDVFALPSHPLAQKLGQGS